MCEEKKLREKIFRPILESLVVLFAIVILGEMYLNHYMTDMISLQRKIINLQTTEIQNARNSLHEADTKYYDLREANGRLEKAISPLITE